MSKRSIINIAILAHVDAGKTTLTEQILYKAGVLQSVGDVNKGTTTTDSLEVEKQRGISVMASHISFDYNNVKFNIIDTPGHADFISEVERSLIAVDAVVLMVSAADGVQAQTKVLWQLLIKHDIPRLIVINKVDRLGVITADIIENIKKELSPNIICLQRVDNEATDDVKIESLRNYDSETMHNSEDIIEALANVNDERLNRYLDGEIIEDDYLFDVYKDAVLASEISPILFSVAKSGLGIQNILDELMGLLSANRTNKDYFSAVVFKVEYRKDYGRVCYLRIFSGEMSKKDVIFNQTQNFEEKVNNIKKVFSYKLNDIDKAVGGEIVAVTGFDLAMVGDMLGKDNVLPQFDFNNKAVLTVEVKAVDENDYFKLSEALSILNIEDPTLQFKWYRDEREYHLKIKGWIQIQILEQILNDRFNIETSFETPQIIYKETPSKLGYGNGDYTMPKPCWAVIKLKIEPTECGSGLEFISKVGVNDALLKYQKEVERTIPKALEQGIKGWELTDLKITLVAAADHVVHSRAGDFAIVTSMAVMNGLSEIGTDMLEPIMSFEINANDDLLGQISGDLHKMRAEFGQPIFEGNNVVIKGKIPAATSMEYPVQLASRSGGKANIQMEFCCYKKVDQELAIIRNYKGISPLDRSKYILKMRNAIK